MGPSRSTSRVLGRCASQCDKKLTIRRLPGVFPGLVFVSPMVTISLQHRCPRRVGIRFLVLGLAVFTLSATCLRAHFAWGDLFTSFQATGGQSVSQAVAAKVTRVGGTVQ
jgi:hypothetical protein